VNCEAARGAMERQFAGELAPEAHAELRAHLETCPSCREFYERLARVDAALERGGLSEQRLEALEGRLLSRVAPASAPAAGAPSKPKRAAWVAALAAVVVLAVAVPLWRATRDDTFTPRGQGGETWGVRAFCVAAGKQVTAEALPGGTLRCAQGSTVQFTYTAPRGALLSIALESTGQRFFPSEGAQAEVEAGTDVALPLSTPIGEWLKGPQRVTARFTDSAGGTLAESTLTLTP